MSKIIGVPVGTPVPRSDWNQTDPSKASYIKNKPTVLSEAEIIELIGKNGDASAQVEEAKKYASSASKSANDAKGYAQQAGNSASTAQQHANAAKSSASSAQTAAQNADTSAQAASADREATVQNVLAAQQSAADAEASAKWAESCSKSAEGSCQRADEAAIALMDAMSRIPPEYTANDMYYILRVNGKGDGLEFVNIASDMYMQTWVIPYLLPMVSTSQDGMVLKVVNGKWALADAPSVGADSLGDIEAALDGIIAIQEELMTVKITFEVDGIQYTAAEGMTWGEWLDSDYNTGGLTHDSANRVLFGGAVIGGMSDNTNGLLAYTTDVIVADGVYMTSEYAVEHG
jgi:hypothetical protein